MSGLEQRDAVLFVVFSIFHPGHRCVSQPTLREPPADHIALVPDNDDEPLNSGLLCPRHDMLNERNAFKSHEWLRKKTGNAIQPASQACSKNDSNVSIEHDLPQSDLSAT